MQAQIEPMQLGRQISAAGGDVVHFVFAVELGTGVDDESLHRLRFSLDGPEPAPEPTGSAHPRFRGDSGQLEKFLVDAD